MRARWPRSLKNSAISGSESFVHVEYAGLRFVALTAGVQKHLPLVLPVRSHTEDLGVEVLRALHVIDMQDDMVDPGRLDHRFLHPPVRLPAQAIR